MTTGRTREKRVLVTPSEEKEINRVLMELTFELETKVCISDVARAAFKLLCDYSGNMLTEAREVAPLYRPANGDMDGSLRYESEIADLFQRALAHKRRRSILKRAGKR